ncbi:MAG: hypothetical protein ACRDHY_16715 [Anaerolineales bacterium]
MDGRERNVVVWDIKVLAVINVLHVLVAATWVGAAVYGQVVMGPLMAKLTPLARREVGAIGMPAGLKFGNAMGGFTLLTGLVLLHGFLEVRGLTWGTFYSDPWGKYVAFALIMNLLVLYLINFSVRPTLRALAKLMPEVDPEQPPPPNVVFLQRRLVFTSRLGVALLLLAAVVMVTANALYG